MNCAGTYPEVARAESSTAANDSSGIPGPGRFGETTYSILMVDVSAARSAWVTFPARCFRDPHYD